LEKKAMEAKTVIGILASHDNRKRNEDVMKLLKELSGKHPEKIAKFQFVLTGGTYRRLFEKSGFKGMENQPLLDDETRKFLLEQCGVTQLEDRTKGVILLADLIVQQTCSILWSFFTPLTSHWLNPENLALLRLCDQWHVKKLMNTGSVEEWADKEAELDCDKNPQPIPLVLELQGDQDRDEANKQGQPKPPRGAGEPYKLLIDPPQFPPYIRDQAIALIAHDEMKERMVEFAIDHQRELLKFKRILTTGTTGREIEANARRLAEKKKILRLNSGPKGGDIEIATEILFGYCHVVVFFVDPLQPHPHIEDIRTIMGACMINDDVRMLTNEMQAREWMDRIARTDSAWSAG